MTASGDDETKDRENMLSSRTNVGVVGNTDDNQDRYIFQEADFEDENFHPAAFVARYRRVAPLDSLKEQLRAYSDTLKQKLYEVINRDYKNFIKIATKLDGIDVRVEKLRQPLVNLRMDVSSLHDLLLSSIKTIQDKLEERERVRARRVVLETCLRCMDKLALAEQVLAPVATAQGVTNPDKVLKPNRRRLLKILDKLPSLKQSLSGVRGPSAGNGDSPLALPVDFRDVFDCSEFERAAVGAAQVRRALSTLPGHTSTVSSSTGAVDIANGTQAPSQAQAAVHGHASMLRQLDARCTQLFEALTARVHSHLCAMFSDPTPPEPRSLHHCLRALVALNCSSLAAQAFAETVTLPFARAALAQGKVDGGSGRGSFAGLGACLEALLVQIRAHQGSVLRAAEDIHSFDTTVRRQNQHMSLSTLALLAEYAASPNVDLPVLGVWVPVSTLLVDRFPGMFSTGIADTFARCYTAVRSFQDGVSAIAGPSHQVTVARRLQAHNSVKEFSGRWRLVLYLQLRTREICTRVDKACELARANGLIGSAPADVHSTVTVAATESNTTIHQPALSTTPGTTPTVTVTATSVTSLTIAPSLPRDVLDTLSSQLRVASTLTIPLLRALTLEALTALHPLVLLPPLAAKFLALSLRIFVRLESFLSTSLGLGVGIGSNQSTIQSYADSTTASVETTPSKRIPGSQPPPQTYSTNTSLTVPTTTLNPVAVSMDDLMQLCADMNSLSSWLHTVYNQHCIEALQRCSPDNSCNSSGLNSGDELRLAVTQCVQAQCNRTVQLREAIWRRAFNMLCTDCASALSGVASVTSRYRMTNKPPPTAASPYIAEAFEPLQSFKMKHGITASASASVTEAAEKSDRELWVTQIVEHLCGGLRGRVLALIDTVRSMDAALSKRAGRGKASLGAAVGSGSMSDSEKILLQLFLDVEAFGAQALAMGVSEDYLPSLALLRKEVAEGSRFATVAVIPAINLNKSSDINADSVTDTTTSNDPVPNNLH